MAAFYSSDRLAEYNIGVVAQRVEWPLRGPVLVSDDGTTWVKHDVEAPGVWIRYANWPEDKWEKAANYTTPSAVLTNLAGWLRSPRIRIEYQPRGTEWVFEVEK